MASTCAALAAAAAAGAADAAGVIVATAGSAEMPASTQPFSKAVKVGNVVATTAVPAAAVVWKSVNFSRPDMVGEASGGDDGALSTDGRRNRATEDQLGGRRL